MLRESPPYSLLQGTLNPLPKHLSRILLYHQLKQESRQYSEAPKGKKSIKMVWLLQKTFSYAVIDPIMTPASGFQGSRFQCSGFKLQSCTPSGKLACLLLGPSILLFGGSSQHSFHAHISHSLGGLPKSSPLGNLSCFIRKKPGNPPWAITSRGNAWVLSSLNPLWDVTEPQCVPPVQTKLCPHWIRMLKH